jgi:hypothetical protein
VGLTLYRCIRISAQVTSIHIIVVSTLIVSNLLVAEWLSAFWNQPELVVWSTVANNDVISLTAQLQSPAVFNEFFDLPEWGTLYHAMKSVSGSSVIRFSHS